MLKSKDNFLSLKQRLDNQRAEPPSKRPQKKSSGYNQSVFSENNASRSSIFSFSNKSFFSNFINSSKKEISSFSLKSKLGLNSSQKSNDSRSFTTALSSPRSLQKSSITLSHKVVIIGGSISGVCAAKYIEDRCSSAALITLIEPQSKVFLKLGAPSGLFDSTLIQSLFVSPTSIFKLPHNVVLRNKAVSIQQDHLVMSIGPPIYFDTLIIATGCSFPPPVCYPDLDPSLTSNMLLRYFQAISKSKSVLVIGGGPTGIETCLRLLNDFPKVSVTLIHDQKMVLHDYYPEQYRKKVQSYLINSNVKLILNDSANIRSFANFGYPPKGRWIETTSGKMYFFDLQINCSGCHGNSDFIKGSFLDYERVVDPVSKLIKVNRYLQVDQHQNIFAIGDVNNIAGLKSADRAKSQAQVVAKNISILIRSSTQPSSNPNPRFLEWTPDSNLARDSIVLNEKQVQGEEYPGFETELEASSSYHFHEVSLRKTDLIKKVHKLYNTSNTKTKK
ncbi:hypothetical protein BB560_000217 [Smittium megazygosporum]|uniref:FAD/NAD(P)-binding domain-containing protein n=1 Tax=Smittium megazygosporum TaxID=133381 RepID=A0A2T9ZL01_9FUNG|nr:hypothetical protein BB560_000217 [Smittium megazygosporum]